MKWEASLLHLGETELPKAKLARVNLLSSALGAPPCTEHLFCLLSPALPILGDLPVLVTFLHPPVALTLKRGLYFKSL